MTGSRTVNTEVDRMPMDPPIVSMSLTYEVGLADLVLATPAGAAELEKRVIDTALAACKEICRQYPHAEPDDAACAKAAVMEAMVKAREAVAAADKKAAKYFAAIARRLHAGLIRTAAARRSFCW